MWRRVASTSSAQLQNIAASASRRSSSLNHTRRFVISSASSPSSTPLPKSAPPAAPHIASASTSPLKKNPQEANPTATGHELEELAAELEGRDVLEINYPVGPFGTKGRDVLEINYPVGPFGTKGRDVLEINYPVGPFGTKEAPAIVKSVYDKRIVGCPGIEGGDDEHDVVWFWLEKGKPYECPVCTQVFKLQVVGKGGPPDGHH